MGYSRLRLFKHALNSITEMLPIRRPVIFEFCKRTNILFSVRISMHHQPPGNRAIPSNIIFISLDHSTFYFPVFKIIAVC